MLLISTNVDQKLLETRVLDNHLLPNKWQSKSLFLAIFDSRSLIVKSDFDCSLPGVSLELKRTVCIIKNTLKANSVSLRYSSKIIQWIKQIVADRFFSLAQKKQNMQTQHAKR